jgi:hypothetical protein
MVSRAVAARLDDTEFSVRVHAALTLKEMVSSHDYVIVLRDNFERRGREKVVRTIVDVKGLSSSQWANLLPPQWIGAVRSAPLRINPRGLRFLGTNPSPFKFRGQRQATGHTQQT